MNAVFEELERQGRTQRWLARQLNIHYTLLSKYRTGERVAPPEIEIQSRKLLGLVVSPDVVESSLLGASPKQVPA